MRALKALVVIFTCCILMAGLQAQNKIVVFQTDFGVKDGAVSAMKGVAMNVSADLKLFDLTHEIPAFNIWEAAYRLQQTSQYWPAGTVFVSVVDPGVGSKRKSVVLKTKTGYFFVTPDNGTLTLVAQSQGIEAIREIDETRNRRPGTGESYTFHGRDVYAYTGARLAAGVIQFEAVGQLLPATVVTINYQHPVVENNIIKGNIPILDIQYGNVWTNITKDIFAKLGLNYGDSIRVTISKDQQKIYEGVMPYVTTFSAVAVNKPLCYLNSLMNVSFALNKNNFSATYKVYSGPGWRVEISRYHKN